MKKYTLLLFLGGLLFAGCKKYPQGGHHWNAKQVFRNLSGKHWDVQLYEVNGIDSTSFLSTDGDPEAGKNYLSFVRRFGDYSYSYRKLRNNIEMDFKGAEVVFREGVRAYLGPAGGPKKREILTPNGPDMRWTITKCKKKDLVLESAFERNYYRIILRRNEDAEPE